MGVIVVFLLAVLFVAAVWGREAAQKLFKGGAKVAAVLFVLFALIIIILAINIPAQAPNEIRRDIDAASHTAYHVPLDNGQVNTSPGAPLRRPVMPQPATSSNGLSSTDLATDDYLTGRSPVASNASTPTIGAVGSPANTTPPPAMPVRTGKPHFGFGYRPQNGFVIVAQVYPGSPAAEAGIAPGMGILSVDGKPVQQLDDVWQAQYRNHRIGDVVAFTIGDANGTHDVTIRLGSDAEPWGASVRR